MNNNNNNNNSNEWALIGEDWDWDDNDNNDFLSCWNHLSSTTTPYYSSAAISSYGSERSQSPLGMLESEYFSAIQPTNNNNGDAAGGGDSCHKIMYHETTSTNKSNNSSNSSNNQYYYPSLQVSSQDSRTSSVDSFDSLAAMVSKSIEVVLCTSTATLEEDYKKRDSMKRLWGGGGGCSVEETESYNHVDASNSNKKHKTSSSSSSSSSGRDLIYEVISMGLELGHDYEPTPLRETTLVEPPPNTHDGWTVEYAMKKIDESNTHAIATNGTRQPQPMILLTLTSWPFRILNASQAFKEYVGERPFGNSVSDYVAPYRDIIPSVGSCIMETYPLSNKEGPFVLAGKFECQQVDVIPVFGPSQDLQYYAVSISLDEK